MAVLGGFSSHTSNVRQEKILFCFFLWRAKIRKIFSMLHCVMYRMSQKHDAFSRSKHMLFSAGGRSARGRSSAQQNNRNTPGEYDAYLFSDTYCIRGETFISCLALGCAKKHHDSFSMLCYNSIVHLTKTCSFHQYKTKTKTHELYPGDIGQKIIEVFCKPLTFVLGKFAHALEG